MLRLPCSPSHHAQPTLVQLIPQHAYYNSKYLHIPYNSIIRNSAQFQFPHNFIIPFFLSSSNSHFFFSALFLNSHCRKFQISILCYPLLHTSALIPYLSIPIIPIIPFMHNWFLYLPHSHFKIFIHALLFHE